MKIVDWLTLVRVLGPTVITLAIPEAAPISPYVIAGITEAEQIPGATSEEKKTHALNVVEQGVAASNAVTAKDYITPEQGRAIAGFVINVVVAIMNAVETQADTPIRDVAKVQADAVKTRPHN